MSIYFTQAEWVDNTDWTLFAEAEQVDRLVQLQVRPSGSGVGTARVRFDNASGDNIIVDSTDGVREFVLPAGERLLAMAELANTTVRVDVLVTRA